MESFTPSAYIPPQHDSDTFMNKLLGQHIVHDMEELHQLAGSIISEISAGDILLLNGELGTGKTTFVRTLATQLSAENVITSPTFTIAAEYDIPNNHIINQLVHMDLYRIEGEISGEDLAYVKDVLHTAHHLRRIVAVEWAERLGKNIPEKAWQIHFKHGEKPNERIIEVGKK